MVVVQHRRRRWRSKEKRKQFCRAKSVLAGHCQVLHPRVRKLPEAHSSPSGDSSIFFLPESFFLSFSLSLRVFLRCWTFIFISFSLLSILLYFYLFSLFFHRRAALPLLLVLSLFSLISMFIILSFFHHRRGVIGFTRVDKWAVGSLEIRLRITYFQRFLKDVKVFKCGVKLCSAKKSCNFRKSNVLKIRFGAVEQSLK